MQLVYESALYRITYDPARRLIRMQRSRVALTPVEAERQLGAIIAVLRPLRGQRMLADVRLAPGNNSPEFEQRVQSFRLQLVELFPTSATLVATAAGRLQIGRMNRERGDTGNSVFLDETEAVAYLMSIPV